MGVNLRMAMLVALDIKDFALIKHVQVSWTSGLNVLTGETGAGKSIIIDALNAVLGGKVGANAIAIGAERATIEATFQQNPLISAWLKQQDLQGDGDQELIIAREISKSASRIRINGTLVNLSLVQDLRQMLLTIHAQHEARTLLAPQSQLDMLDGLGDKNHQKLLDKVRTLYVQKRDLTNQLKELQISEDERLRRLDFAAFQLQELEQAELGDPDEYESISNQCRVLSSVVVLEEAALDAQQLLSAENTEGTPCVIDLLQQAVSKIERAAELDNSLLATSASLHDCLANLEDSVRSIRRYKESLDTDPETLSQLGSRLDLLASIKRKYGPDLAQAISRRQELSQEVVRLQSAQSTASQLQAELSQIEKSLGEKAQDLSVGRQKLAKTLAQAIHGELTELGMERCRFEISVDTVDMHTTGQDKVEFLISPNPGQPLLPVAKIASGGELSRVMLAIKSIFAEADRVATVVFDEIDTGLSGKVLQSMRDKLARLARSHQILCITHQPIIASVADNHILINKDQSSTSTHISISVLDKDQRIRSLAGMASGQEDQKDALQFARSLFAEASKLKAAQ